MKGSTAEAGTDADPRGHNATSPWRMPRGAWKDVLVRSWKEASADNIGIVAAGVSFYGFLALVPLMGATVLTYGFLADPQTVVQNMAAMMEFIPREMATLIGDQLMNIVQTSGEKKGLGVLIALAVALFGARNGASAVITALNIAYEEEEKRGFLKVSFLALVITGAAVLLAVAALLAMAALAYLEALLPYTGPAMIGLSRVLSCLLLGAFAAAAAATLYRFGPSRRYARWSWLTPGSALFAVAWVVLTIGFSVYVAEFGNYNATYGSLGAVVMLLTWMYLSSYVLVFGAELNSELEHQTARDSTRGAEKPLGTRGAWVADHVAEGEHSSDNPQAGRDASER